MVVVAHREFYSILITNGELEFTKVARILITTTDISYFVRSTSKIQRAIYYPTCIYTVRFAR